MYESQIELKSSRILEALTLFTKLQIKTDKKANSLRNSLYSLIFLFRIHIVGIRYQKFVEKEEKERMNYNIPAEIRHIKPSHEQLDNNAMSM